MTDFLFLPLPARDESSERRRLDATSDAPAFSRPDSVEVIIRTKAAESCENHDSLIKY